MFRSLHAHLKRAVEADESLKGLRLYVNRRNAAAKRIYQAMGMDGRHYEMFEWLA